MKYKKKPVVIEAIQWTGKNLEEVKVFAGDSLKYDIHDAAWQVGKGAPIVNMKIHTLEGVMDIAIGDFIIRGVKGEYYPCKPDIFEQTYEKETGRTEKIRIESDGQTATVYLDREQIKGTLLDFSFHGDVENGIHIKWDGAMQRVDENGRAYVENDEVVTEEFHYDSNQAAAYE